MCEWFCVGVSVSVWYVYAYVHVDVPTLLYVCVYVCMISMGAVFKECCLFDKHILAPRKLPRSFNKYLLQHFSDGHCYGDSAVTNTGIGPDATGFTFELEETIFIIWFLKVIENL